MAASATTVPIVKAAALATLATVEELAKVYGYEPRDLDARPAATVQTAKLGRVRPDEAEDELGRDTLHYTFTLRLYIDLDDPEQAENDADELLGAVIGAFDSDPTLGNSPGVIDAKVTTSEYGEIDRDSKPMLGYVCELEVLQEVS